MNMKLEMCKANDVSTVSHNENLMEIHNPRNYNHELKKEKQRESNEGMKKRKLERILGDIK